MRSSIESSLHRLNRNAVQSERERRRLLRLRNRLAGLFPDLGPLSRDNYPKHLEFFAAGAEHRERMFCAGNRVGKTIAGAYESALHLTGAYPDWWVGRRFSGPIEAWIAGQKSDTTRDIVQMELMGKWGNFGTGMIPYAAIIDWTTKGRPAQALDTVQVRHVSGGVSTLGFKNYSEGPDAFQGTAKHLIWFDEECSIEVYAEALIRTAIVPGEEEGGIVLLTFTPLHGWTSVVDSFLGRNEGVV